MARIDKAVGAVTGKLREKGLLENTLIIFTSDNGPHSEGGYQPSMLNSSGSLRGHKRDLYEGGIRVPFIAHWPSSIQAGRISSHPSAFWDFLPTACEIAGIPIPADIQGISLFPTLLGKDAQASHDHLYWEFHELGGRRALRSGDWKIVQYDLNKKTPGRIELYHLKDDPSEIRDLADKHPEILETLTAKIQIARVSSPLFPMPSLD